MTGPLSGTFFGSGSALSGVTGADTALFSGSGINTFSLTSHVHDYLPLSGGTVAGTTTFNAGLSATSFTGYNASITGYFIGSGSGLSGVTGVPTTHYHPYLPLSGGTVTGATTFTVVTNFTKGISTTGLTGRDVSLTGHFKGGGSGLTGVTGVPSTHYHSYVPLSGVTYMTGPLSGTF